ncbi:hypothetical protein CALCODRAFT_485108 [Calocera cornea HHB12733]|uniref:Uncharacterized protein n=1 Tax=Calocera cornea HHB12733 TaxID=1353952 RepID=A0A165EIX4_9BASI|nr:hypothetical protein CALCODRAFT_485108 [Calocera cornea HHB12733]
MPKTPPKSNRKQYVPASLRSELASYTHLLRSLAAQAQGAGAGDPDLDQEAARGRRYAVGRRALLGGEDVRRSKRKRERKAERARRLRELQRTGQSKAVAQEGGEPQLEKDDSAPSADHSSPDSNTDTDTDPGAPERSSKQKQKQKQTQPPAGLSSRKNPTRDTSRWPLMLDRSAAPESALADEVGVIARQVLGLRDSTTMSPTPTPTSLSPSPGGPPTATTHTVASSSDPLPPALLNALTTSTTDLLHQLLTLLAAHRPPYPLYRQKEVRPMGWLQLLEVAAGSGALGAEVLERARGRMAAEVLGLGLGAEGEEARRAVERRRVVEQSERRLGELHALYDQDLFDVPDLPEPEPPRPPGRKKRRRMAAEAAEAAAAVPPPGGELG